MKPTDDQLAGMPSHEFADKRDRTSALVPIPGATPRYDDDGREIVDVVTCGSCGRSWNNAASSSLTPAPSGRCPFEYEGVSGLDSEDAVRVVRQ